MLYEDGLSLSEKIRSARRVKKRKMHQITTQKLANSIFELLHFALHNDKLKKANVSWKYLEFAPKFIDDAIPRDDPDGESQLDDAVQIDLVDVGFEIVGVTMPNHRQYAVIWWKHNALCKLNGGIKLVDRVLDLYRDTLRAVIARKLVMKRTPRCIFRMVDDSKNENAVYHKEKMEDVVEAALIEKYQKAAGIEFEDDDVEDDQKYKNEKFHDLLMTKIYGDWRRDENGQFVKAFNLRNGKKQSADKWIDLFLTEISTKNKSEEKKAKRERRKKGLALKAKERAEVLNRILSADPNFGLHSGYSHSRYSYGVQERKLLQSSDHQPTDLIVSKQSPSNLNRPRIIRKRGDRKQQKQNAMIMVNDRDLDLVGFVE